MNGVRSKYGLRIYLGSLLLSESYSPRKSGIYVLIWYYLRRSDPRIPTASKTTVMKTVQSFINAMAKDVTNNGGFVGYVMGWQTNYRNALNQ